MFTPRVFSSQVVRLKNHHGVLEDFPASRAISNSAVFHGEEDHWFVEMAPRRFSRPFYTRHDAEQELEAA